jgi:type I restriction enzyme S subunit
MRIVNIKSPVRLSWLYEYGARLDAQPFVSGAIEARETIKGLTTWEPLRTLTRGHNGGIFNGPQFSRTYVNDPRYGVPFVGSTDMNEAELSRLPRLRKRDAFSSRLAFLELQEGMTLISCSGTIGRMAYVRPSMVGMWSSQHVMKVAPNRT